MKPITKYTEIIDRYLDGELSGEERDSLEKELKTNLELSNELELQKEIKNALGETEIIGLREQLKDINLSYPADKKVISFTRRLINSRITQMAAASVIILLSITLFTDILKSDLYTNEKMFEQYYEKYEPLNVRASANINDEIYQDAVLAYNNEEFEQALLLFEKVLEADQGRMEANIMSGVSNMELNNYQIASGSFNKVIDHNDNLFMEDAQWYLGFCYLKTENKNKAVEQFTKIAESSSSRSKKARKILRKIE